MKNFSWLGIVVVVIFAMMCNGVNAEPAKIDRALMKAAADGDKIAVEMLLDGGANVNVRIKKFGPPRIETPLKTAIRKKRVDIARLLVRRGAHKHGALSAFFVSSYEPVNEYSFVWCNSEYKELFKEFITSSSQKELTDCLFTSLRSQDNDVYIGKSAERLSRERCQRDIVRILIESGANLRATFGKKNDTVLTYLYALNRNKGSLPANEDLKVLLIENGAPVNQRNKKGDVPLFLAIRRNEKKVIRSLLEHGANINRAEPSGITLLHYAAMIGDKTVAERLVKYGADVTRTDKRGKTAYDRAIEEGNYEVAKFLKSGHDKALSAKKYIENGITYYKQKQYDEAYKSFSSAIDDAPLSDEAYARRGRVLYKKKEYKKSIEDYQKALEIRPNSITYRYMGWSYARLGIFDKAVNNMQKAIEITPDKLNYYNIACIYALQNKVEEACMNLKKAIKLGYHEIDWIKKDSDLRNIQNNQCYKDIINSFPNVR